VKVAIGKILREANFLSLAGNLTFAFFGFAGFAFLARSFPLDVFGQWVLYISSGTFIEMFRFGITNTAIVRYLSGVDKDERLNFIGSNGLIGLVATTGIAIILWTCHLAFGESIKHAGYELFFTWYPVLAFFNLPFNTALVVMQADQKFSKILWIKSVNSGGFFLVLLSNYLFFNLSLMQLIWFQLGINLLTSAICVLNGWDGLRHIRKATSITNKVLLNFGKYTTFTLIGTNLLRSADTLIISLSPLGTAAVALYSIPMKLTELQQIPLRSFAATAFPKLSKASIQGKIKEVRSLFYSYAGAMTYLFIFISLITFVFADFFVMILGGSQYLVSDPVTGANATTIVRIFSVYGLLLPLDRMTGLGLDSINKPGRNLLKVICMVVANVIGDLIAVFVFKSLAAIAVASILFTMLGVWLGYIFLDKELQLDHRSVFTAGIEFYKSIYIKFRNSRTPKGFMNHLKGNT
jgi:O-antigen/teichoic acid export membrane protein